MSGSSRNSKAILFGASGIGVGGIGQYVSYVVAVLQLLLLIHSKSQNISRAIFSAQKRILMYPHLRIHPNSWKH